MSSFGKDFERTFEPVDETVVLGDIAAKLMERHALDDPEVLNQHHILVCDPTGDEWLYPITGEVMIGRAPDNQISLNDRSVSRYHMAINTDGTLYWFQDLDSGNGTQVDNEFVQEGWLTGGEEIAIGNSRLYFHLPQNQQQNIGAPQGEAMEEQPFQEGSEEAVAAEGGEYVEEGVEPEEEEEDTGEEVSSLATWLIAFVFFLGLAGAGFVGWWIYKKVRAKKMAKGDSSIEKKIGDRTPERQGVQLYKKGKSFLIKKEWRKADLFLRRAASQLQEKNPLRAEVLLYAKIAGREINADIKYRRAKRLYTERDKVAAALRILSKIPISVSISHKVRALRERIYKKDINPLLREALLLTEAQKIPEAISKVKKILEMEPNYVQARDLLKRLLNPPPKPEPIPERRVYRRRPVSLSSLNQGVSYYRNGQFARAIVFFRRQEDSASQRRVRRAARRYRKAVQSYQRNWIQGQRYARRGSTRRAISYLRRAYSADKRLRSSNSRKIKKLLSRMYYRRGRSYRSRGSYASAAVDFKRAYSYDRSNYRARRAVKSLRSKAKSLVEEGEVLIGLSNGEARKKLRQAKRLLSSSDPLYKKVVALLAKTQ